MNIRYFRECGDDHYCYEEGNKYEMWYLFVNKERIWIQRGSEDHGGEWGKYDNLVPIFEEAISIWRSLNDLS